MTVRASPSSSPRSTATTASTGCRRPRPSATTGSTTTGSTSTEDVLVAEVGGSIIGVVERGLADARRARLPPPRSDRPSGLAASWPRPGAPRVGGGHGPPRAPRRGRWGRCDLPHVLAGWSDLEIPESAPFAAAAGYHVEGYGVMMTRPLDAPIPDAPLPDGLEVRPVRPEDHRRDLGRRLRGLPGPSRPDDADRGGLRALVHGARARHVDLGGRLGRRRGRRIRAEHRSSPRRTSGSGSSAAGSSTSRSGGRGASAAWRAPSWSARCAASASSG